MIGFEEALEIVRNRLEPAGRLRPAEAVALEQSRGRILAEDVFADRDLPPFDRATRDGFAVRSQDLATLPVTLKRAGQVRAGEFFEGQVGPAQCIEIMTGAPLPSGADAVAMVEHTRSAETRVEVHRAVGPFENVVRRGSETAAGSRVLERGRRLGPAEIGLLAAVGKSPVRVFSRLQVAILPTGDEVVPVERRPEWFQVRNSNAFTLAAQAAAAGALPCPLGIAPDQKDGLRRLVEEGLKSDLLLLSGGISMGRYDFVADVLKELGAEFFFQGVAIRPGKPLAFGRVGKTHFFGLPGNPVSTFVTFEIFVRRAIEVLGGGTFEWPVFLRARLGKPLKIKLGLTAFFPARVERRQAEPVVELVGYQGSGDLVGTSAANCFLVIHPEQTALAEGDWVDVLPKPS
jgi:molybdopterin molybdotransferase